MLAKMSVLGLYFFRARHWTMHYITAENGRSSDGSEAAGRSLLRY